MKLTFSILLFIVAIATVHAQDKIYKKDKTIIDCKITEIGINEIKYKIPDKELDDSPVIAIAVTDVVRVLLSSGREIEFKDPLTDPISYVDDRKQALKFHFLSPLAEHLGFSYEKSIRPGRSFETGLGIIGAGFNSDSYVKSSGAYISSGYKFMKTPDFYAQRMKYAHILKGSYVKPQVLLSIYHNEMKDVGYPQQNIEQDIVAGALIINLGKQIIYDNFFLIDYSVGLGYGFSNQKERRGFNDYDRFRVYHYGFIVGERNSPIAATAKLKIGILIK
ncbi:hypothetical protein C900_03842 [Fulvivirga imtechensis AK7]|uniref:Outer membrane protein beta-barrel domain-containing protein n=1 Tax=Fulvivirga imtechensis AK7 TaxID=1237149 RepID=L8JS07_9BACT|nr:hypothetical protein [Fulvivirga imtechensis]ELR70157.1 hypothetical protein C900_03842 [Fulvivirga imtechensis AK7]